MPGGGEEGVLGPGEETACEVLFGKEKKEGGMYVSKTGKRGGDNTAEFYQIVEGNSQSTAHWGIP